MTWYPRVQFMSSYMFLCENPHGSVKHLAVHSQCWEKDCFHTRARVHNLNFNSNCAIWMVIRMKVFWTVCTQNYIAIHNLNCAIWMILQMTVFWTVCTQNYITMRNLQECHFPDFCRNSDFFRLFSPLFFVIVVACIVCVTTMRVNWWLSGQFWLRKSSSFFSILSYFFEQS